MSLPRETAPRRILMTVEPSEQPWAYTLELCRGLREAGVEVVLGVSGPRPDQRQLTAALCLGNVEVVLAPFRREGIEAEGLDEPGDWLLDLEVARQCELVHLHGYEHGTLPFRGPKVIVGAACGLSWWRAVKGGEAPAAWDSYRRMVSAAVASADCVVAPSSWLLSMLEEHYGPLPAPAVIPPGRSASDFAPGEKEPVVLAVGSLTDESRNTASLARVAGRLPWPVKIAGASGLLEPDEANDMHTDGAILLGRVGQSRMASLFGRAAIFTSMARFDPLGLHVHAAALSECALVLSDIPSTRELWGGAAVFVAPDDDEALETALCTLMNQPELAALLAIRARQRAVCLSATRMVKRYLAIYRRLVALRRPHGWRQSLQPSCLS
jgi:glycogen(starch) synthase